MSAYTISYVYPLPVSHVTVGVNKRCRVELSRTITVPEDDIFIEAFIDKVSEVKCSRNI